MTFSEFVVSDVGRDKLLWQITIIFLRLWKLDVPSGWETECSLNISLDVKRKCNLNCRKIVEREFTSEQKCSLVCGSSKLRI